MNEHLQPAVGTFPSNLQQDASRPRIINVQWQQLVVRDRHRLSCIKIPAQRGIKKCEFARTYFADRRLGLWRGAGRNNEGISN